MRTTLNIDADVLQAVKKIAKAEKSNQGRVISHYARLGLTQETKKGKSRNGVPILPTTGKLITSEHIQQLIDEECI